MSRESFLCLYILKMVKKGWCIPLEDLSSISLITVSSSFLFQREEHCGRQPQLVNIMSTTMSFISEGLAGCFLPLFDWELSDSDWESCEEEFGVESQLHLLFMGCTLFLDILPKWKWKKKIFIWTWPLLPRKLLLLPRRVNPKPLQQQQAILLPQQPLSHSLSNSATVASILSFLIVVVTVMHGSAKPVAPGKQVILIGTKTPFPGSATTVLRRSRKSMLFLLNFPEY